jgi:ParB/RepB/Spo0J family partition protein
MITVKLDDIEQNENARTVYKTLDLSELIQSLKDHGLLQPVGVRKLPGGKWDAVYGNRRIVAARKLGWKTIPATIVEASTDADRDILGLVENLKRRNTSVSEDGRIFQKLKDLGLSVKEIATRLGESEVRINHALDIFNEFPDDVKASIVHGSKGTKGTGKVHATLAFAVNSVRKDHKLSRKQTRTLLKFASDGATVQKIRSVAPLVAAGLTLQQAIGRADRVRRVTLEVFVDSEWADKLQKKTGKTIHEHCYALLESDKTLKVARILGSAADLGKRQNGSAELRRLVAG